MQPPEIGSEGRPSGLTPSGCRFGMQWLDDDACDLVLRRAATILGVTEDLLVPIGGHYEPRGGILAAPWYYWLTGWMVFVKDK